MRIIRFKKKETFHVSTKITSLVYWEKILILRPSRAPDYVSSFVINNMAAQVAARIREVPRKAPHPLLAKDKNYTSVIELLLDIKLHENGFHLERIWVTLRPAQTVVELSLLQGAVQGSTVVYEKKQQAICIKNQTENADGGS